MATVKATKKEAAAIQKLKEAIDKLPDSLWLFADGSLHVMKKGRNGEQVMNDRTCGYSQDYVLETIQCDIDGGDW